MHGLDNATWLQRMVDNASSNQCCSAHIRQIQKYWKTHAHITTVATITVSTWDVSTSSHTQWILHSKFKWSDRRHTVQVLTWQRSHTITQRVSERESHSHSHRHRHRHTHTHRLTNLSKFYNTAMNETSSWMGLPVFFEDSPNWNRHGPCDWQNGCLSKRLHSHLAQLRLPLSVLVFHLLPEIEWDHRVD